MSRAPSVCSSPGCPELVPCPTHRPIQANGTERRARRGSHRTGWEEQERNRRTIRRWHGICYLCGHPGATEVDHVIPLDHGGTDDETNRRPAHHPCHLEKTRRDRMSGRGGGVPPCPF